MTFETPVWDTTVTAYTIGTSEIGLFNYFHMIHVLAVHLMMQSIDLMIRYCDNKSVSAKQLSLVDIRIETMTASNQN